jgi:hypothetical protein
MTSTTAVETTVLPMWGVCCDRFDVIGVDHQHLALLLQQVEHRTPVHASPNVAKTLLNWEYVIEILQVDLRTSAQNHPLPLSQHAAVSHEGSSPQGLGAAHVHQGQIAPAPTPVTGGHRHV